MCTENQYTTTTTITYDCFFGGQSTMFKNSSKGSKKYQFSLVKPE